MKSIMTNMIKILPTAHKMNFSLQALARMRRYVRRRGRKKEKSKKMI